MAGRFFVGIVAVMVCLALPQWAAAQAPTPQVYAFQLDAPDDGVVEWDAPDVSGFNTARLRMIFTRTGSGKVYFPSLLIQAGSQRLYATLEMAVAPSGQMPGFVTVYEGDKEIDKTRLKKPPSFGQPIDILLSWTEDGEVTARILTPDGVIESHRFNLGGPVEDLGLAVSTGSVNVQHFTLSHDGTLQGPRSFDSLTTDKASRGSSQ